MSTQAWTVGEWMPWTCAAPGSLWQVTGWITEEQPFYDQLAIAGVVDGRLRFRLLGAGLRAVLLPHHIVAAHQVIAVYADNPLEAVYAEDQHRVNRALAECEPGVSADG